MKFDITTFKNENRNSYLSFLSDSGFPLMPSQESLRVSKGKFRTRTTINEQLFTGTWQIDILKPIGQGHFIVFKGDTATGKTSTTINAALNFISSNSSNQIVYVGTKVRKFEKSLSETNSEQFSSIDTSQGSSTERILAYTTGIALAESLSSSGKNILFILDDFYNQISMETDLRNTSNVPALPWDVLKAAFSNTGSFEKNSFTTIVVR